MSVAEQPVDDAERRGEDPSSGDGDGWPPKPRRSTRTTPISPWVQLGVVVGIALIGFVVWWFAGLRHDVRVLSEKVDAIAEQGGFVLPDDEPEDTLVEDAEISTLPPEPAPPDAETARRMIDDAVTAVFTPAAPVEVRAAAIAGPGDLAQRLADVTTRPNCADVTLRVDGSRFSDHDTATSSISFSVPRAPAATGYSFEVEVIRVGDEWKVGASSVDDVLRTATSFCG